MESKYLLSLCIPTYNRGNFLNISLSRIEKQLKNITDLVELVVSDNCSTDNTTEVVQKYIDGGLPVIYIRNQENIGPDGNFVQCFCNAKGKYVWVLGDDDFLEEGVLVKIMDVLKTDTFGLIHLQIKSKGESYLTKYDNPEKFLLAFSYWITFLSSNIVNSKYVSQILVEKNIITVDYIKFYITAALSEQKNAIIYEKIFEGGADSANNGGYNLFEVFVSNYLKIWKEFVRRGQFTRLFYEKQKYRIYKNFLTPYIFKLLIKKDIGNFKTDNAWQILFSTYGLYPYFYGYIFLFGIKERLKMILNKLK
jgi:glycosyltransferase involved in cell wall biosynthesis